MSGQPGGGHSGNRSFNGLSTNVQPQATQRSTSQSTAIALVPAVDTPLTPAERNAKPPNGVSPLLWRKMMRTGATACFAMRRNTVTSLAIPVTMSTIEFHLKVFFVLYSKLFWSFWLLRPYLGLLDIFGLFWTLLGEEIIFWVQKKPTKKPTRNGTFFVGHFFGGFRGPYCLTSLPCSFITHIHP